MTSDAKIAKALELFETDARIVDKGAKNFMEVGEALARIRDQRTYLCKYRTFEECVQARWGWTRQNAYLKMKAARAVKQLPDDKSALQDSPKLTSDRSACALADVSEAKRGNVLADAGEKPTAKSIAKAAAKAEAADDPKIKPKVAAAMGEAVEFDELMSMVMAIRKRLTALQETTLGAHLTQQVGIDLKNVWHALKFARPYGPCGYCNQRGCKACKGQGWWSHGVREQAPKEYQ